MTAKGRTLVAVLAGAVLLQSCIFYFFRDTDLGGWEFVGPDYLYTQDIWSVDIAEMPDGNVALGAAVMSAETFSIRVELRAFDGRRWVEYATARTVPVSTERIRIGILDNDALCLVSQGFTAEIASWDGVRWETITLPPGAEDHACVGSAITENGELLVGMEDPSADYALSVYRYAGGSWTPVGAVPGLPDAVSLWLAVDVSNQCIVYHSGLSDTLEETTAVYRENGATWDTLAALPAWARVASALCRTGLVVSGDNLSIGIADERQTPVAASVLISSGDTWSLSGGSLGGGQSYITDLGVAPSGNLLAYVEDDAAFNEISAFKWDGSSWQQVGIPGFSFGDAPGDVATLAASDGRLYVAYIALGHDRRISVMSHVLPD